jgi:ribA/ribD-fused uncharacterized protein
MTVRFYGVHGNYGFLSNFYRCIFTIGEIAYPSAEHCFQAAKAMDPDVQQYIRSAWSPSEARRRGRECECRPDWEDVVGTPALAAKFMDDQGCVVELVKDYFMYSALITKFSIPELRMKLLATGTHELIEASRTDSYWGEGEGGGKNKLGRMLQLVRKHAPRDSFDASTGA